MDHTSPARKRGYNVEPLTAAELAALHELPDDALVTNREAAALLRLSPFSLSWCRTQRPENGPPHVRIGIRTIRYRMGDLRAHMKRRGANLEG